MLVTVWLENKVKTEARMKLFYCNSFTTPAFFGGKISLDANEVVLFSSDLKQDKQFKVTNIWRDRSACRVLSGSDYQRQTVKPSFWLGTEGLCRSRYETHGIQIWNVLRYNICISCPEVILHVLILIWWYLQHQTWTLCFYSCLFVFFWLIFWYRYPKYDVRAST